MSNKRDVQFSSQDVKQKLLSRVKYIPNSGKSWMRLVVEDDQDHQHRLGLHHHLGFPELPHTFQPPSLILGKEKKNTCKSFSMCINHSILNTGSIYRDDRGVGVVINNGYCLASMLALFLLSIHQPYFSLFTSLQTLFLHNYG